MLLSGLVFVGCVFCPLVSASSLILRSLVVVGYMVGNSSGVMIGMGTTSLVVVFTLFSLTESKICHFE